MVFSNFFKNLGNGIKFSNLTVCCLKRLDNAFDSCYKQGKERQFSLWRWTQAQHPSKETESCRRFWPFHPAEQDLWGPSWYNNGLLIPNPPGRCTSPNTALVGQSGHHSWNSKQLRWIESHSWCPDWPTRAVLGGTPTLRVGYYLNTTWNLYLKAKSRCFKCLFKERGGKSSPCLPGFFL